MNASMRDFANVDGKKIKRIMKAGATEFFQHPNGVIIAGGANIPCYNCGDILAHAQITDHNGHAYCTHACLSEKFNG